MALVLRPSDSLFNIESKVIRELELELTRDTNT
jgi:hypothetical protein